jgi:CubicO group peptidase (beta-lactamase class C family)
MITLISILAFAAIFSFVGGTRSRRGPGLDDISAFADEDIEHTDTWLQGLTDSFYPSLSAVVVRNGEVVYQGAFGLEDIESQQPATARTQYHVASVTKVFMASIAAIGLGFITRASPFGKTALITSSILLVGSLGMLA